MQAIIILVLVTMVGIGIMFLSKFKGLYEIGEFGAAEASLILGAVFIMAGIYTSILLPASCTQLQYTADSVTKIGNEYIIVAGGGTYHTENKKDVDSEDYALQIQTSKSIYGKILAEKVTLLIPVDAVKLK